MSNFWKGVQIGFLDDQSKQLAKRREEALEYKRQQQERAKKSRKELQQRKTIADMAVTKAAQLQRLGVTEQQIAAAAASGPEGIFTFADDVISYAKKNNINKFTESQVQSLIDTPEILKEDLGEDFNLKEFIRGNYGLVKPTLGSEAGKPRNILQRAFAIGERDAVRADLEKDAYYEGYSIFDLNELASMDAYGSLLPGSYATFTGVDYDPVKVMSEFDLDLRQSLANAKTEIDALEVGTKQATRTQEVELEVINRFLARPYGDQFLESLNKKGGRFSQYYKLLVPEKSSESIETEMAKKLMDVEGPEQSYTENGMTFNYKIEVNEKGMPTFVSLNGIAVPRNNPEAMLAVLKQAQSQGLFPDYVFLPEGEQEEDEEPNLSVTGQALDPENIAKEASQIKTETVSAEEEEPVDPEEKFEVKQITDEQGTTKYIVVDKATGEKVKGSPDFMFYDLAQNAIVADEFPSVVREVGPVTEEPDAAQMSQIIYDNPEDETYLIKVKGKLKKFRVSGEDLKAIPQDQIGTNVTIMKDDKPDRRFTKKSANALETMFTPMGTERKEVRETQSERSKIEDALKAFMEEEEIKYDDGQAMIDAWERWSTENEVEDSVKQRVLNVLKKMYPVDN